MTSLHKTLLCHYRYDPLDRLTCHVLPEVPERQRFYRNGRLTSEIQGVMRYSIVQQGNQLLAQQRIEGNTSDTTLLVTDQQRSVWQAVKADHSPQSIVYTPYGHRSVESALISLLGFNGERPDPVTGCYLLGNGYRAFNPVLMRFNSPDSWSPFGAGGLNAYAYCVGDPVNQSDPNGHSALGYLRALFTGKAKIMGTTYKISPGVSTRQAMRAKKEIKHLTKRIDHSVAAEADLFEKDYKNRFIAPAQQRSTLQNIAAEHVGMMGYTDDLIHSHLRSLVNESKLQRTPSLSKANADMLEHIKEPFSVALKLDWRALDKLAAGHVLDAPETVINLAKSYKDKIDYIRNQREVLEVKRDTLAWDNFKISPWRFYRP